MTSAFVQTPFLFKKLPEPRVTAGYGILNRHGGFWTPTVFETPKEAMDYVKAYWAKCDDEWTIFDYKICPVTVTIAAVPDDAEQPGIRMTVHHMQDRTA